MRTKYSFLNMMVGVGGQVVNREYETFSVK